MRRMISSGLVLAFAVLVSCTDDAPLVGPDAAPLLNHGAPHAQGAPSIGVFRAPLDPGQEVTDQEPHPEEVSDARGNSIFQLSRDGESLRYRITLSNLEDVMMSHIHVGEAGVNGPVVVWLYPTDGPPPELIPGVTQGVLAEGVITADDLVGQLEGESLETLLDHMREGNTYVNVHTVEYPGGEIRGQIQAVGPQG